ncbi:hypothetical protein D3C78_1989380 [compost metagenome]
MPGDGRARAVGAGVHDDPGVVDQPSHTLVGASLLAMVVNDNVGRLVPLGVLETIASRLAPTG